MEQKLSKFAFIAVSMGFLYYCYEYLLRISPSVMQDNLMQYFDINATLFGTLSAFYYYAYTPMQLVVGVIVDKYNVKKVLLAATLMCALGTFMISHSNSYPLACAGRFLQGFASAFAWVSILKLGVLFLPPRWLGFVSGVGSVFGFLGAAAGQTFMGYVVQHIGWKVVLESLAILGIPMAFLIFYMIKKAEISINKRDQQLLPQNDIHNIKVWLIRFLIVLRKPQVWQAGIIAALLFLPTAVFAELWGVEYMRTVYMLDKVHASFVTAMIFIGWAIGSLGVGVLSVFFTRRLTLMQVGIVLALIMSLIMLYVKMSFTGLCSSCIFFGIFSAVQVLTFPMGMEVVSPRIAGIAGAFVNFLCMLSGMVFQRVAGQLLDFGWSGAYAANGTRIYSAHDYKIALCIIPISLGIGVIFIFLLKNQKKRVKNIRHERVRV